MGYGLLCGEGEEDVYSAGEDCEAGCLVGWREGCGWKGGVLEKTIAPDTRWIMKYQMNL